MLSESGSAWYACIIATKLPAGLFAQAAHVQAEKLFVEAYIIQISGQQP